MSTKTNKYAPSTTEKAALKKAGIILKNIANHPVDELQHILNTTAQRANELFASYQFQTVPSIGAKFAEDLIVMGYYSLAALKHKTGEQLIDQLEQQMGCWIDPCVEDQCRLVVHFANTGDRTKNWWHFTEERKAFRSQHGYPASRPRKAWFEALQ